MGAYIHYDLVVFRKSLDKLDTSLNLFNKMCISKATSTIEKSNNDTIEITMSVGDSVNMILDELATSMRTATIKGKIRTLAEQISLKRTAQRINRKMGASNQLVADLTEHITSDKNEKKRLELELQKIEGDE
ncbi:uncharacterized protein LOC110851547 [Folsomia candida]|uniref:Uncharacterized protein n=1 Tax=Folsomia candida TaxID=158441 RepID=A0A226E6R2_FOLCA|nr:uncharacterized protein LOC110851547 [Folsomia candida]OXA52774.1 hypothetical protein Fcan01_12495 [Folsomia candida]